MKSLSELEKTVSLVTLPHTPKGPQIRFEFIVIYFDKEWTPVDVRSARSFLFSPDCRPCFEGLNSSCLVFFRTLKMHAFACDPPAGSFGLFWPCCKRIRCPCWICTLCRAACSLGQPGCLLHLYSRDLKRCLNALKLCSKLFSKNRTWCCNAKHQ